MYYISYGISEFSSFVSYVSWNVCPPTALDLAIDWGVGAVNSFTVPAKKEATPLNNAGSEKTSTPPMSLQPSLLRKSFFRDF